MCSVWEPWAKIETNSIQQCRQHTPYTRSAWPCRASDLESAHNKAPRKDNRRLLIGRSFSCSTINSWIMLESARWLCTRSGRKSADLRWWKIQTNPCVRLILMVFHLISFLRHWRLYNMTHRKWKKSGFAFFSCSNTRAPRHCRVRPAINLSGI